MTPPRIALFALTGFGNTVLPALCAAGLKPELLVTRPEPGPYPYYREEPLVELAGRLHVAHAFGAEGERKVEADPPDIILCATYHRVLRGAVVDKARWAINLHPSLLPRYRGPNPFYWVIRNREPITGVTAHLMMATVDAGPIVAQRSIDLAPQETQGSLRRRLAAVAAALAVDTIRLVRNGAVELTEQDETKATAFDRPSDADRTLHAGLSVEEAERVYRAALPYPGAAVDSRTVREVVRREPASAGASSPTHIEADLWRLHFVDGDLVVRLA